MNKENRDYLPKRESLDPRVVGLLMVVVALVAPYGFDWSGSFHFLDVIVYAAMWTLWFSNNEWGFWGYIPFSPLLGLMLIFWYIIGIRILFAYYTVRYYKGKTTKAQWLALGIVAELPMVVVQFAIIIYIFLAASGVLGFRAQVGIGVPLPIPIPLLLTVGILLIRFFAAPPKRIWDSENNAKDLRHKIARTNKKRK